jgi:hypothetical protein
LQRNQSTLECDFLQCASLPGDMHRQGKWRAHTSSGSTGNLCLLSSLQGTEKGFSSSLKQSKENPNPNDLQISLTTTPILQNTVPTQTRDHIRCTPPGAHRSHRREGNSACLPSPVTTQQLP